MPEEEKISEWNEGNLMSWRIHEAKTLINIGKSAPFQKFPLGFGFECWFKGIDMLYGEGDAKYNKKELIEVDKLKKRIIFAFENNPPVKVGFDYKGKRWGTIIYKNWVNFRELLEIYERIVKTYNDKHGLGTRNKGKSGMF